MATPKTVLITGSTSGIGLSIARKFAQQGCNVVFNGLEADGAQIAQQVADEYGIQHRFYGVNIMDTGKLQDMLQGAHDAFGTIDILVNNAGVQFVCPVEDFPDEKWDLILGVNLTAAFHTTKAVWKGMKENKWGRIINIASAHGLVASEFKSAYIAAKHGLVGFTKCTALEGAPYGITVNAICPGYVHTPIVEAQIGDQMKAHQMDRDEVIKKVLLGKQAIKEFIPVEAISDMVVYMASDAAQQMTGTAVPIDGGWTAQ
ncbi:MAG: 3-hydroxybutyrate dehydrogenase [Sphingobacteriales bacterium]|nr:MAG: 3-hydroxybutyrate dehydrogenase [Sphingobacteriales bacterium]